MAIFQPSNITPSNFAGLGSQTIDVKDNISISWQVNGNSSMTAFRIQIYNNSTSIEVKDTGRIALDSPFYGIDNKGNPKQFTYNPSNTLWSSWGLSNGNEYKMIITQYWGTSDENSVTQYSGSVFLTRETPIITIIYTPSLDSDGKGTVAKQGFSATISPTGTVLNSVRWQFGKVEGDISSNPIDNSLVTIIDDTGAINTNVLEYEVSGLLNGNNYAIKCTIETADGIETESGWQGFAVEYATAETKGEISTECLADDSVLLSWGGAVDIEGVMSPDGESPEVNESELFLAEGQSVTWDKVNKTENLDFPSPWSMAWKGEIAKISSNTYSLTASAIQSTEVQTVETTTDNFNSHYSSYDNDNKNDNTYQVYGAGKWIRVTHNGVVYISGSNPSTINYWTMVANLRSSEFSQSSLTIKGITYGNGYYVITGTAYALSVKKVVPCMWYSRDGQVWDKDIFSDASGMSIVAYGNGMFAFWLSHYISSSTGSATWYEIHYNESHLTDPSEWNNAWQTTSAIRLYSSLRSYAFDFCNGEWFAYGQNIIHKYSTSFEYTGYVKLSVGTMGYRDILRSAYNQNAPTYKYVAITTDYYYVSRNGTNWGIKNYPSSNDYGCDIIVGGNFTVIATRASVLFSTDNLEWYNGSVTGFFNNLSYYKDSRGYSVFRVTGAMTPFYEFKPYYTDTKIVAVNGWLNTYNVTPIDSVYQAYATQNAPDSVTLIVESTQKSLPVVFSLIILSLTSTASQVFTFTEGTLSTAKITSVMPTWATSSLTISGNNMTINVSIPTANGQAPTTMVEVNVCHIYDEVLSLLSNGLIETDKFIVSLTKKQEEDGLYSYGISIKDILSSEVIGSVDTKLSIPSETQTYSLYSVITLTPSNIQFYLFDKAGNFSNDSVVVWDSTIQNENITSIKLLGKQVCEWLYITIGDKIINSSFQPIWNVETLFSADFALEDDYLQAGTSADGLSLSNFLYREQEGRSLADTIGELPPTINMLKDYGTRSGEQYIWELYYLNGDESYSEPINSGVVCKQFRQYTLLEAQQDEDFPNVYHVVKVWRFGNNLSVGGISNNNTPNWLTNFTPYRLRQPTARLGQSGTLQALLRNYNQRENFYEDTVAQAEELKKASVSTNTFFLKDMKGNLYMVGISAPITQTMNIKSKVQEITVSVPWEEVGDASNVSLIQLPTDEGWDQDEGFSVEFTVDLESGLLSATYPKNYYGTTFNMVENSLYAETPSIVNRQIDYEIKDGSVIATKELTSRNE